MQYDGYIPAAGRVMKALKLRNQSIRAFGMAMGDAHALTLYQWMKGRKKQLPLHYAASISLELGIPLRSLLTESQRHLVSKIVKAAA